MDPPTSPSSSQTRDSLGIEWIGETADDWDKRSVTKSYHRMKAEDAVKYVEGLRKSVERHAKANPNVKPKAKVEWEKLEDEEHRIIESRARLNQRPPPGGRELDELQRLFWEWRKGAEKRTDEDNVPRLSSADRKHRIKPTICPGPPMCNGVKDVREMDDPVHDLNVYFMFYKKHGDGWKGADYHKHKFPRYEHFPNQRISLHDALYDNDHNPFKPITDNDGKPYLRYIHIPANHMGWIEQAMARYHDEHEEEDRDKRVKTSHTLSREFWKGQLHGSGLGRNPIHATHMRPRCSVIPGETQSLFGEQKPDFRSSDSKKGLQEEKKTPHKDLAIFMPYLHWETSSRRARMTRTVQAVLNEDPKKDQLVRRPTRPRTATNAIQNIADQINYVAAWQNNKSDKPVKRSALAKYLLKLAQVWQDMDMELDERLVRHELLAHDPKAKRTEPLLHIRRTLDQSYFLNLKDTSQRDRDQVVYRATKWQGNLARVVMVDQLWLWILDEHTVITSFPKRWGRNKPDPSGIHKSLRERLQRADCKIMSARHLACIIIDQCSNVFFDRTKPLDLRPEVMDIFAETIGDVNYYTTVAFKWFWWNVERSRLTNLRQSQSQKYLDINLEGTLLREAQDIAEELKIMISIYSKQLGVVKSFQKCLENINGKPKTRNKPLLTTKMLQDWFDSTKEQALSTQAQTQEQGSSTQAQPKKPPVSAAEMDFLDDLVEEVEDRRSEIMDLERAALLACQQLQELLSLKQQQASIVAAQASLERADQSVEQGKAIMAFTIMTIIFTPLGFFTSFFGMNNALTGADWMTLGRQCLYMFCISAIIIVIALSLAFNGSQIRHFMQSLIPEVKRSHFKAKSGNLRKWFQGKPPNSSEKTTGKNESKPTQVNGAKPGRNTNVGRRNTAMEYFQLPKLLTTGSLSHRRSRNDPSQADVENPFTEHELTTYRSRKTG